VVMPVRKWRISACHQLPSFVEIPCPGDFGAVCWPLVEGAPHPVSRDRRRSPASDISTPVCSGRVSCAGDTSLATAQQTVAAVLTLGAHERPGAADGAPRSK